MTSVDALDAVRRAPLRQARAPRAPAHADREASPCPSPRASRRRPSTAARPPPSSRHRCRAAAPCTACRTFQVASTPTGRSAVPLTPPVPKPSAGRRDSTSMTSPGIVFTRVIASAPASTATDALRAMSGSVGDSFTKSGRLRRQRARVARPQRVRTGSAPNSMPAGLHVRAAHVDLVAVQRTGRIALERAASSSRDDLAELLDAEADDVRELARVGQRRREPRKVLAPNGRHARDSRVRPR